MWLRKFSRINLGLDASTIKPAKKKKKMVSFCPVSEWLMVTELWLISGCISLSSLPWIRWLQRGSNCGNGISDFLTWEREKDKSIKLLICWSIHLPCNYARTALFTRRKRYFYLAFCLPTLGKLLYP